jgi:hypothetical protein
MKDNAFTQGAKDRQVRVRVRQQSVTEIEMEHIVPPEGTEGKHAHPGRFFHPAIRRPQT